MKKIKLFGSLAVMCLISQFALAQDVKTESFKVSGNCGMCEEKIEGAAKKVEGVRSADWNKVTKQLKVNYASPANKSIIQKAIAAVGYDTEGEKALAKTYDQLHECCQYPRESFQETPTNSGKTSNGKIQTVYFEVSGMTCADGCAKGIEKMLYKQKGVKVSEVNFNTAIAKVIFDSSKISVDQMKKIIQEFNNGENNKYHAEVVTQ